MGEEETMLPAWAPRVPQAKIRRLYELDAQGIYDDERSRQLLDVEQVIAGEDVLTIAFRKGVFDSDRADGNYNPSGGGLLVDAFRHEFELDSMGVHKGCLGREDVDAVAHQLVPRDVDFRADDVIDAKQQIAHRDVLFDGVGCAVNAPLTIAREPERSLAKRLARNRAGVDADASDDRLLLDDGDAFIEFGRLNRGAVTGRSGTDDQQVVIEMRGHA